MTPGITYALSDPRMPNVVMYYGSTSQEDHKRLSDHVSAARFAARNGKNLTKVMQWILGLDEKDIYPVLTVLYEGDLAHAQALEDHLIRQGGTLNKIGARGGRTPGSRNTAQTIQKMKKAHETRKPSRTIHRVSLAKKRKELGYPFPELDRMHPKNWVYHRMRQGKPIKKKENLSKGMTAWHTKRFMEYRLAMGYPDPMKPLNSPENRGFVPSMRYKDWICSR